MSGPYIGVGGLFFLHNRTESFNILLYVSFRICISENEFCYSVADQIRKLIEETLGKGRIKKEVS